jgi:hypothetical protein
MANEYVISGQAAINLDENSATPSQSVLTVVHTSKGNRYFYAKAGAQNISANSVCTLSPSTGRVTANTTNGLVRNKVALTAGYYGWVRAANTSFSGT